jgi:NADPH:quinone reductase-like Zn-dependent oxidoreductase
LKVGDRVVAYGALTCGTCKACREGRDNLCENVAGIMGFHVDGFRPRSRQHAGAAGGPDPGGVSFRDAACAPVAFGTVQHMLFDNAKLEPGETILVQAGGSGIGTDRHQDGEGDRRTVITTVGDDAKAEKAKALGADHVINYRTERFETIVRKLTGKKGVDVAFEHVGPDTFNGSLLCLKRGGRLVTCGSTSGQSITINLFQLYLQQYRIFGSFGCSIRNIRESLAKMASGHLPVIDTEVRSPSSSAVSRGSKAGRCSARSSSCSDGRRRFKLCSTRSSARSRSAARRDQAHRPKAHGEFRRRADAQGRPAVQGAPARPRQLRAAFPEKSDAEIEKSSPACGTISAASRRVRPSRRILRRGIRPPTPTSSPTAGIEGALRPHHEKRQGDDRLCRPSRQLGASRRRRQIDRREIRRAVSAAEYRAISDVVVKLREPLMGELIPTGLDAPVRLARLLQSGVHVGMLADQHYTKGVEVTFFGRRCLANPLVAMLARQTELPITACASCASPTATAFGARFTDPIEPVRDADGRIDIKGTMQAITSVIEGWMREHPEQWLWLHRRWR